MKPYVLHAGEGRTYLWHGVRVEVKAARAELNGSMALTESITRKGEEPHTHVHDALRHYENAFSLLEPDAPQKFAAKLPPKVVGDGGSRGYRVGQPRPDLDTKRVIT